MKSNLGQTGLRRKRRVGSAMHAYDALPAPLRQWLAQAALPWSPASARRIWSRTVAKGRGPEEALAALTRAEQKALRREGRPSQFPARGSSRGHA